jgi:hypothetical protein
VTGFRIIALLLAPALGLALATAGAAHGAGSCTMRGPHWTLYPAHSDTAEHGSRYQISGRIRVGCAKAKRYIRRMFDKNPKWPYATFNNPSTTLKGGPAGWHCASSAESRRNRHSYQGACIGPPGSGEEDFRQFYWGPDDG